MTDRFYGDLEVPVLSPRPASPPEAGFVQLYGTTDNKLAYQTASGNEVILDRQVVPRLTLDGGSATTTPADVRLRIDFGPNGATA